jgi:predicted esterase
MDEHAQRRDDLHRSQRVEEKGAPLAHARAALIMLHGRGGSAADMLALADALAQPHLACLAPQAAGHSWYPHPFTAPIERNEPWLSSALRAIDGLLISLGSDGFASDRVVLLGFSQGACLGLEYAARRARRYAGVIGLSGGLIGPEGTPRDYPGTLAGTPVFLAAATSTRTSRSLGSARRRRCYAGSVQTSPSGSIPAWAT